MWITGQVSLPWVWLSPVCQGELDDGLTLLPGLCQVWQRVRGLYYHPAPLDSWPLPTHPPHPFTPIPGQTSASLLDNQTRRPPPTGNSPTCSLLGGELFVTGLMLLDQGREWRKKTSEIKRSIVALHVNATHADHTNVK